MQVAEMRLNKHSSRGHGVFLVNVKRTTPGGGSVEASMSFVDLMGSEPMIFADSIHEGSVQINQSLLELQLALRMGGRGSTLLPWLLKDYIQGNCKPCILLTASPHMNSRRVTLNTLDFGIKAKGVERTVHQKQTTYDKNELIRMVESASAELQKLRIEKDAQIAELEARAVGSPRGGGGHASVEQEFHQLQEDAAAREQEMLGQISSLQEAMEVQHELDEYEKAELKARQSFVERDLKNHGNFCRLVDGMRQERLSMDRNQLPSPSLPNDGRLNQP